ncbi:MAG TPA: DUF1080 domain-containing protein [Balneolaceae bacterium]|nr:DUF1080 domain-containing protein [Balneolaceae bacterium]
MAHAQTIHLFNGKNLDDWYAWQQTSGKHDNAADIFSVEDHMIRLYGPRAGYLMSKRSFHNFKLTVEYRWNTDTTFDRKNNHINSGIMYLVPAATPDTLWPKGIQFQVKKDATGDFIFLRGTTLKIKGKRTTPGRSVISTRFQDAAHPIGEWDTVTITYRDNKITQQLNGKLVNEGTDPSVTSGRIMLMYEGFPIDFRKVELKKL